jgi:glycerol-3-phosphate acyltransferase PlsY
VTWPLLILLSFLCGSIPFGLLIARAHGVDIRTQGSGNIGATNVWRVLGRGPGLACFALDVLKGLLPVLLAAWCTGLLARGPFPGYVDPRHAWLWMAVMAAAIAGHMFSPWIGFHGGKGVATGLGAVLGVYPFLTLPALGALAVWILCAAIWRYVSLASITAAAALPLLVLGWSRLGSSPDAGLPFVLGTAVFGALIILKHRANIRRLLAGTENRIGPRRPPAPAP